MLLGCANGTPPLIVAAEQRSSWERNFNPLGESSSARWPTLGGIFEPLMVHNAMSGTYEPWLATGYEWDETDQVLVFTLRPGVLWSDGVPFSTRDVVFTYDLLRQHPRTDHNQVWHFIRQVQALDDQHVEFVFQHTFVPGLEYLAHQPVVPEHIWRDVDDPFTFTNPSPVATGPFTEVRRFTSEVFELGRNPHYWQPGKPAVAALRMPLYRSNDEMVAALLAGRVDWLGGFVPQLEERFVAADPAHRGFWSPLIDGPVLLLANTTVVPFDETAVRQALSMAVDRQRLVDDAMNGYTRVADATGLDDAQQRYLYPEASQRGSWIQHDPEAADKVLDDAGYLRGQDGWRDLTGDDAHTLQIIVPEGWSDWVAATRIIAEGLAEIGIRATPDLLPTDVWYDRVQRGEFSLSLGGVPGTDTPYLFYRALMSSASVRPVGQPAARNWQRCADPRADALLEAYEMTSDQGICDELCRQLQLRFVELVPAIPLFYGPSWGVYNSARYNGFPSEAHPYAALAPYRYPDDLLVLTTLVPNAG